MLSFSVKSVKFAILCCLLVTYSFPFRSSSVRKSEPTWLFLKAPKYTTEPGYTEMVKCTECSTRFVFCFPRRPHLRKCRACTVAHTAKTKTRQHLYAIFPLPKCWELSLLRDCIPFLYRLRPITLSFPITEHSKVICLTTNWNFCFFCASFCSIMHIKSEI